jgi:hypothetical protein
LKVIKKEKGLVPSSRERPFISTERLSRCGKRRESDLHLSQTSLLPKADKPYPNKEEGQNKAEKELAVANHDFTDVVGANVQIDSVAQHNVTRTILSRVDRKRICGFQEADNASAIA